MGVAGSQPVKSGTVVSPASQRLAREGKVSEVAPFRTPPHSPPTSPRSRRRGAQRSPQSRGVRAKKVPTVVTWSRGGAEVYVEGSWDGFKERHRLSRSTGDFTTILELEPGAYQVRYVVDGERSHDPQQPLSTSMSGGVVNLLSVEDPQQTASSLLVESSTEPGYETPPGSYTQSDIPAYSEASWHVAESPLADADGSGPLAYDTKAPKTASSGPPSLPHHLLRPLLNARQSDPSVLPVPHHVSLQHVSVKHSEPDISVLGTTSRFRKKFVTVVYMTCSELPKPH